MTTEQVANYLKIDKFTVWPPCGADETSSLQEGLEETFTLNRLNLSPSLSRCLATTKFVENPHSGVRLRTNRVSRWRDGEMVKRWVAAALLAAEKNFRGIMGYRDLWMLEAHLEGGIAEVMQE